MFSRPFPSPSQESGRVETAVRLSLLVHRLLPDGPIRTCAQPLIHCPPLTADDFKKWKKLYFSSYILHFFLFIYVEMGEKNQSFSLWKWEYEQDPAVVITGIDIEKSRVTISLGNNQSIEQEVIGDSWLKAHLQPIDNRLIIMIRANRRRGTDHHLTKSGTI